MLSVSGSFPQWPQATCQLGDGKDRSIQVSCSYQKQLLCTTEIKTRLMAEYSRFLTNQPFKALIRKSLYELPDCWEEET